MNAGIEAALDGGSTTDSQVRDSGEGSYNDKDSELRRSKQCSWLDFALVLRELYTEFTRVAIMTFEQATRFLHYRVQRKYSGILVDRHDNHYGRERKARGSERERKRICVHESGA